MAMEEKLLKVALVGNPNSGKTTLFNRLTGMNQKVGNFPGVTVEKRISNILLPSGVPVALMDLPGSYSLSANSQDEMVVQDILLNPNHQDYPDVVVLVVDVTNILRNLFFASQIIELGIPVVLALNMMDLLLKQKQEVDMKMLGEQLGVPVLGISARSGLGVKELLTRIENGVSVSMKAFSNSQELGGKALQDVKLSFPEWNNYTAFKNLNNYRNIHNAGIQQKLADIAAKHQYDTYKSELLEINERYGAMDKIVRSVLINTRQQQKQALSRRLDRFVTHPVGGLFIFLLIFFFLFQAVFTIAAYPMDWIDTGFSWLGGKIAESLPESVLADVLIDGILPGLAGVLVFLPQIMILFGLITILEDSGYLSRVSFMSDGILRKFGMNGKAVIPLVGGFACAVPSIMAARTIENKKERIITMFIIPLMSCSARLPVYVFLVAFIVPDEYVWGIFSVQALFMLGLYLLGLIAGMVVAATVNKFLKSDNKSSFLLELPAYKAPSGRTVLITMRNKGKTFVVEAGKIILLASLVLWALSYVGPTGERDEVRNNYETAIQSAESEDEKQDLERKLNSALLEVSFLGYIGKSIEPAIRPLGFDWKIGIALVNSFAAREVFVGTMATIYSVEEDEQSAKGLRAIKFSYPVALSLLLFYVFALQCMSTIAVMRQETRSWKWPALQFFIFTAMAYLSSLLVFQMLG